MAKKTESNIYLIGILFLIAHLFIYVKIGIISNLESEKYIRQAELLLNGQFPSAPKYYYYLPIILLIALIKKLSLSYVFIAIIQSAFSFVGTIAFYKATWYVFNKPTALFSTVALCLFFPFYSWNFHLYSDSIFITLSLLLYYAVCKFENQTAQKLLLIFCVLISMIFTRPFGVLFIPPLFFYFLLLKYENAKMKTFTAFFSIGFLIIMALIIDSIFHGGEDMDAMKPFVEEHIICFVPNKPEGSNLNLKYYDNGLRDIFYYIIHNPSHFINLMLQRLYSFFKLSRPWFTSSHNLYLALFTIPAYTFFLIGLFPLLKLKKKANIYFLALIILYPLAVTFQCDDWHGRFTMPIIPPVLAISAYGFLSFTRKSITVKKGSSI